MTIGMLPLLILGGTNVVLRTVRRVHCLVFIHVIVGIKYYGAFSFFTRDDIALRIVQVVIWIPRRWTFDVQKVVSVAWNGSTVAIWFQMVRGSAHGFAGHLAWSRWRETHNWYRKAGPLDFDWIRVLRLRSEYSSWWRKLKEKKVKQGGLAKQQRYIASWPFYNSVLCGSLLRIVGHSFPQLARSSRLAHKNLYNNSDIPRFLGRYELKDTSRTERDNGLLEG